jgi:2-keto-4-pentenoate hydratase
MVTPTNSLQAVADSLWRAQHESPFTPVPPVRDAIRAIPGDEVENAYGVQRINMRRQTEAGARVIGRKIGLTSRVVQAQLGVDQPDFGVLFDHMAYGDGEEIPISRTQQPKVEAEIALVLERDLVHDRHTLADIIGSTAYALPAIEVVGSRIEKWDIKLADTVADNASSGLFVVGSRPVKLSMFDIVSCGMVMERNGDQVSVGAGAACLGNPLNAAVWLANTMVRLGEHLRAGDIILTGALGPMVPVADGDVFNANIQGLGEVRALFSYQAGALS